MRALSYAMAALLILFGLLCTLPFTASGTRLLLQLAERSGVVQAQYQAGSLFGDLQLEHVEVNTEGVSVKVAQLESRLDLGCFWTSTFCFETLRAAHLSIVVNDSESDSVAGDSAVQQVQTELISLPYAYHAPALQIERLTIRWPGGQWRQGTLRADVSIAGSRIDIAHAEVAGAELLLAPDEQAPPGYQGFMPPQIFLPLDLRLQHLLLQEPQFHNADGAYTLQSLALSASWRGYALELDELAFALRDVGSVAVSGSVAFQQQWPLQLNGDVTLADTIDIPRLNGRELQVQLEGDLQSLQVAMESLGEPDLTVRGGADMTAAGLPFQAESRISWPQGTRLGDIFATGDPLAELEVLTPVDTVVSGSLQTQQLKISTRLSGQGYQALALTAQARMESSVVYLDTLDLRDAETDSQLQGSGQLTLGSRWMLALDAISDGFYLPPLMASEAGRLKGQVSLQISGDEAGWRLEIPAVNVQGIVNGLPATVAGQSGLTSSLQLLPGKLEADVNGAQLSIDADREAGGQARLSLQLGDLGLWVAGARGSVALQGRGLLQRQTISVSGTASDIAIAGVSIPDATLAFSYGGEQQNVELMMQAPAVRRQGYHLDDVTLSGKGTLAAHRLQLSTQGRIAGDLRVDGSLADGQWQGSLAPARLLTSSGSWALDAPVAIEWDGQHKALRVAAHCWQHPDFELCAGQLLAGNDGDISLSLKGDVSSFNGLLPAGLQVRGGLESQLKLVWNPSAVTEVDGTVSVRDLRVDRLFGMGESVTVTWESADLVVAREGGGLSVKGDVVRQGNRVLVVDALLPESSQQPISGSVTLDALQLATFAPWVTELSTLEGALSGRLELAGTAADPQARGNLRLSDGKLVVVGNPTELTALSLDLQLDGSTGQLQGSGLLGGGEVSLRGNIVARPKLSLELAISGERHQVLLPPASEMLVSEELSLLLTDDLLDVGGDIHVHEGVLRHEELPAGSVGISRDVVQVDLRGNVISEERPFDVRADILIHLNERFSIEGEELKATLGGDLQLRKEPGKSLQVFGNLNLQGGELFVYRNHLQVQRGTIAFSGPPDNPELNISAEREIRDEGISVGARLSGPLEEPLLEVYSDPVMSQGEAMSYLVRGRGLDAGAGADGTALALSLGADIVNRSGVVAELNRLPLVSNVAFGASGEEDDTAATVSGYIGSRIYVSYGIGLYEPINVLTARLYLQSRLWLEVMSRLENSVDLYYSFDIP